MWLSHFEDIGPIGRWYCLEPTYIYFIRKEMHYLVVLKSCDGICFASFSTQISRSG